MALINDNKRFIQWAIALSLFVSVLITLDFIGDYRDGVAWTHLLTEVLILTFSLAGIVYFGRLYHQFAQSKINLLRQDLALANQQAQQWREANRGLIEGLAAQIKKQFDSWQLTPAEAEVGMLMLKGLSFSEIAGLRNASERTVRDQARAIYRKSGLAGRTELSAFFLEDLLLPRQ
ncbi:helix-turn-helix transcriptional regulator [Candidatus Methylobacter oryzae]|uniref:Response regulator transcription factor n=1 Tax=Candidatus Methylobacter oryzae TaxID=2497749 RepID=A0ABY3CAX6_9GAMM|nr:LuxR C-terminal-related transcriptional regulator [Candidatus Methylobacter oryzae]TRW95566.1 response regulator transcription factor [Candidatus Methylobacter oryzae]